MVSFVREIEKVDRFVWTSPERFFEDAREMEKGERMDSVDSIVSLVRSMSDSIADHLETIEGLKGTEEGKQLESIDGRLVGLEGNRKVDGWEKRRNVENIKRYG